MVEQNVRGSALLPVMLLMFLFSAIVLGASAVVRVEITVGERFRGATEALYAAEAALASTVAELRALPSWNPVIDGTAPSASAQGLYAGNHVVPGGGLVRVCCGPQSAAGRLARDTSLSPLPARRAVQWRPFLWTTEAALLPGASASRRFLLVWVADDEGDGDGVAGVDANGIVLVRAEAVEPGGLRRAVEAYVQRPIDGFPPPAAVVSVFGWREVR